MHHRPPSSIKLHRRSQTLEIIFAQDDQANSAKPGTFYMDAEYLRVFTPSAEARGHGGSRNHGDDSKHSYDYPIGKKNVALTSIEAQGNYGIRLHFSDKHNSGIYSWSYLRDLAENHDVNWATYLAQLHRRGKTRDPKIEVVCIVDSNKK